jgi:putative phosphoesterase
MARDRGEAEVIEALAVRDRLVVGLVSDTHIPEAAAALHPLVLEAFSGVDLIMHAGDIHDLSVIDALTDIAPTIAARGNGEEGSGGRPVQPEDPRLRRAWLLQLGGITVGLVHELPVPELPQFPPDTVAFVKRREFGTAAVDVIIFGDTHVEAIEVLDGSMCVNPGSPTLPHNLTGQLGTIGLLHIRSGIAHAEILQLGDGGLTPYSWPSADLANRATACGARREGWRVAERM